MENGRPDRANGQGMRGTQVTGYRFIIADDHPLFRHALTQALRDVMPDAETIEAGSLREARAALARHPDIDLELLDHRAFSIIWTLELLGGTSGQTFSRGSIRTPIVVNAAGPWAGAIGRYCGVDVPVEPERRHIFIAQPSGGGSWFAPVSQTSSAWTTSTRWGAP